MSHEPGHCHRPPASHSPQWRMTADGGGWREVSTSSMRMTRDPQRRRLTAWDSRHQSGCRLNARRLATYFQKSSCLHTPPADIRFDDVRLTPSAVIRPVVGADGASSALMTF
jgi:hypothetical protein